ncbi:MAG: hypothetical protein ACKOAV_07990 [Bacteroidota bacterium]
MHNPFKLCWKTILLSLGCWAVSYVSQAQNTDSTKQENSSDEDFSMYDNVGFADEGARRYCSPKIEGLSPAKLISVGYDFQAGYGLGAGGFKSRDNNTNWVPDSVNVLNSRGLRLGFNIPVISRTNLVWQMGANYWEQRYFMEDPDGSALQTEHPLLQTLSENGLRTLGVSTTVFKPLDDKRFLLFQGSADLNGDFSPLGLMPLKYLKYSAALVYGLRPNEKKQWGLGLARTYRVGELNYIPVFLFNWTDPANKWGTEILFQPEPMFVTPSTPATCCLEDLNWKGKVIAYGEVPIYPPMPFKGRIWKFVVGKFACAPCTSSPSRILFGYRCRPVIGSTTGTRWIVWLTVKKFTEPLVS